MPLRQTRNGEPICSFCRKRQNEVDKLIAGPNVNICDECVIRCAEFVAAARARKTSGHTGKIPGPTGDDETSCSFCGKRHNEANKLVAGPDVNICDECVGLCVEIVLEARARKTPGYAVKTPEPKANEDHSDEYCNSQEHATPLSVTVHNCIKRLTASGAIDAAEIEIGFVQDLEEGPAGSGVQQPVCHDAQACSFCGKRHGEVEKLFSGRDAIICNVCVALCAEIVKGCLQRREGRPADFSAPQRTCIDMPDCSFCWARVDEVNALLAGPGVNICDECVSLCTQIMEEYRARKAARDATTAPTPKDTED